MTNQMLINMCTEKRTQLTANAASQRTGLQSNKPELAVLRPCIYFPQDYTLTAGETITHRASFRTRTNVITKEHGHYTRLYRVTPTQ